MKLWKIERLSNDVGYDEFDSFIIRAENETEARVIAAENCADEGTTVWLDSRYSTCKEINKEGEKEVILSSFKAG